MKNQDDIESKILEHYEKIRDFAQTEINRTFTVYKFLFWGITIILAIGIAVGGIILGRTISEIEVKYENAYNKAVNEEKERVKAELKDIWEKAKLELNSKIEYEFNRENISTIVETNAKQRIDIIADRLIEKQIENKITPLKDELKEIEVKTTNRLEKLIFDYFELGVYNNSSKAFSKLYEYSLNEKYEYQRQAKRVIESKITDLELFYSRNYGLSGSIIDVNVQDLNTLYKDYYTKLGFENRIYFLEDFWVSNHSKKDKIDLMIKIFRNEVDLKSSYFISKILVKEFNLKLEPADFNNIMISYSNKKIKYQKLFSRWEDILEIFNPLSSFFVI